MLDNSYQRQNCTFSPNHENNLGVDVELLLQEHQVGLGACPGPARLRPGPERFTSYPYATNLKEDP
jgi:hypothetical protein